MLKCAKVAVVLFVIKFGVKCQEEYQDYLNVLEIKGDIKDSGDGLGQEVVARRRVPLPVTLSLIECYICTDCPKVFANTTIKPCPIDVKNVNNKCVIYSEKYKHMQRPWFIRACATERGSCADIRKTHEGLEDIVRLTSCLECDGDRCNTGSTTSLLDLTTHLFIVIIIPLLGKYILT